VAQHEIGSSEASGDVPAEDLSGEAALARVDHSGACDWYSMGIAPFWYSQDSTGIDAMLAQERGLNLMVAGPQHPPDSISVEKVGATRSDPSDVGACKTEVLSLKSFLDEDIPKFHFNRTTNNATPWSPVEAENCKSCRRLGARLPGLCPECGVF
jgi:hypothetical protein